MIQKHLNTSLLPAQDINSICAFTGKEIDKGISLKEVIKDTFTDHSYLKYNSEYASIEIAASMANIIEGKQGLISLRNFSFIVNDYKLVLLKNSEIMDYILNPIKPPFRFCISFSNKKHLYFKSKINLSKEFYTVTTDLGDCEVSVGRIKKIFPILQKWYTVIPGKEDTTQKETWFTKQDILHGSRNFKRIEQYGYDYFEENQILNLYRNTLFLKILTHCLTKKL